MSVCLRFSIEFAKLQVVEMVHANIRESGDALRRQEAAVTNWKKRCEMQLQMLGVCRGYGVFEMVPENQPTDYECPFTISDAYRQNVAGDGAVEDEFVGRYYITPGCQVWIRDAPNPGHPTLVGAFFNPCRHSQVPCTGKPAYSLQQLLDDAPNTRLPFDPRATGSRDVLGTWPLEFTGGNASQNERLATIARELEAWQRGGREEVPWRLSHEFIKTVVEEGGSNAEGSVGNTRGAWGTSEGFASAGSAEFCDSIADWWPEVSSFSLLFHRNAARSPASSPHFFSWQSLMDTFAMSRATLSNLDSRCDRITRMSQSATPISIKSSLCTSFSSGDCAPRVSHCMRCAVSSMYRYALVASWVSMLRECSRTAASRTLSAFFICPLTSSSDMLVAPFAAEIPWHLSNTHTPKLARVHFRRTGPSRSDTT